MKIVCCVCKKVIGEKPPFKDSSEIRATCTTCIEKAREEAAKYRAESALTDGKEIVLENGIKGTLWIAKSKTEKLFFGEMAVSGRKFFCSKNGQDEFKNYLEKLTTEEADVTLLHSIVCKMDAVPNGRKKKVDQPKIEEPKKNDSIQYNCTIRAPKHYIQFMYDDMAKRINMINKILAETVIKTCKEDCQNAFQSKQETVPEQK